METTIILGVLNVVLSQVRASSVLPFSGTADVALYITRDVAVRNKRQCGKWGVFSILMTSSIILLIVQMADIAGQDVGRDALTVAVEVAVDATATDVREPADRGSASRSRHVICCFLFLFFFRFRNEQA
ncbi:unnamed protein product [Heligmosomoides polygyrus]|uniref:Secreted protein n=1 Tax=Heligmosomoides polygyrus TaxID=6339 RepID=A0A183G4H8_HELPZ|nr:unnamed protein product [Heligmosomoides polygyrus]